MVAVLALIHKRGGRCSPLIASPSSSVVRIRDSKISRRLPALYRQLTLRPARLITTSAPSNAVVQSSRSVPFHETTGHGSTAPLRDNTVTALPVEYRCATRILPKCPVPPGMTMRSGRRGKDRSCVPVSRIRAVSLVISVCTEYTATTLPVKRCLSAQIGAILADERNDLAIRVG